MIWRVPRSSRMARARSRFLIDPHQLAGPLARHPGDGESVAPVDRLLRVRIKECLEATVIRRMQRTEVVELAVAQANFARAQESGGLLWRGGDLHEGGDQMLGTGALEEVFTKVGVTTWMSSRTRS